MPAGTTWYRVVKAVSFVALIGMAAAIAYASWTSINYWTGIGV